MLHNFGVRLAVVAGLAAVALGGGWIGTHAVKAQESAGAAKWKLAGSTGKAIGALAVDESDGTARTLLAAVGDEIRKTSDGGESWARLVEHPFVGLVPQSLKAQLPLPVVASARSITVSPPPSTHHLVLASSAVLDTPAMPEIWRSTDGGSVFHRVVLQNGYPNNVFSVMFDPNDNSGLRAYAFVDLGGGEFQVGLARSVGKVYVTEDGGATWRVRDQISAAPDGIQWPSLAAIGASNTEGASAIYTVLIPRTASELPWLFRSAIVGMSSAKPLQKLADMQSVRAMVADDGVPGTLYVASKDGVLVSADDGVTWRMVGEGMAGDTVTALAIHEGTRTLFAGTATGKVWALQLPAASDAAGSGSGAQPTANNPRPTLTSISPTNAQVGSVALTLTLTGTNFLPSSTVNFGSTTLSPGSITATSMTATVPNSAYAQAGVVAVTVANPGPGGGNSGGKQFKVQDFKFGPITPTTQTIIAGATATYKVQLLGLEGYNTEVTMTCSNGTPPAATCYFDPTDVTPSGIENVTITTTTNNAMSGPGRGPGRFGPLGIGAVRIYLVAAGFFVTGIYFLMGWRRRGAEIVWWRRGGVVVALWLVGGFVVSAGGCGGYNSNSSTTTGQGTTPGTYTITLSAAGVNDTTHNQNIVLVVNNPQ